jgi:wax ester synthase-like acyl-CoA acyltransferase family protein
VDLTAARDATEHRIQAVPRLRQHLIRAPFAGGRPVWADDPDFDIRDHVNAVDCPAPGDENAVLGLVAGTLTHRLPRNRPLWSATLVTSLSGGRAALVVTLYHVLSDGLAGLAVLAGLVAGHPPGRTPPSREPHPGGVPCCSTRRAPGSGRASISVDTAPCTARPAAASPAGTPSWACARVRRVKRLATSTTRLPAAKWLSSADDRLSRGPDPGGPTLDVPVLG